MATEVAKQLQNPTWSVGETGLAGPVGYLIRCLGRFDDGLTFRTCVVFSFQTGGKAGSHLVPGYCCFAVVGPVNKAISYNSGIEDREKNMILFAKRALELLAEALDEAPPAAASSAKH